MTNARHASTGGAVVVAAAIAGAVVGAVVSAHSRTARADVTLGDSVHEAAAAITAMEVDRAQQLLAPLDASTARVSFQLGRLAMEVGDCDEAVRRLSPPNVQALEDAGVLLNVARTCARAMAATVVVEDREHQVIVRLQDDADRSLVPLIGETLAKHREVIARDLGVEMPRPARVDVVRDQFSLSAMTGLSHKAAQTTGTVAIARFGRVIMLSPRAPSFGYGWRDTLAHEYTHLALTRGSLDHAPLWLQEGVAKREETRWRAPGPADEALPPDSIAAAGLARGLGRPLDGIGPSVALLPSAREAMVVYAEVTSFVRFLSGDRAGAPGAPTDATVLPKLVSALGRGLDTDAALKEVTGRDLNAWNAIWRPWVVTRGAERKLPASLGLDGPSALATPADKGAAKALAKERRGQAQAFRIGELLIGRAHGYAARTRLDPLALKMPGDPLVGSRAGAAHLLDGDGTGALTFLDPGGLLGNLGLWWTLRGEALRITHAPPEVPPKVPPEVPIEVPIEVEEAYEQASAHDPFLERAACGWADVTAADDLPGMLARGLCATARARMLPKLGQD